MAWFFGRYEHSLDDKGRVILPAKLRPPFEHGGFLSPELDGCLSLWTPNEFEVQMNAMKERSAESQRDRNLARLWSSDSQDLELDKQGRLSIPSRLRTFAKLESEVLVLGTIDHVELWDRRTWEAKVLPSEDLLTAGDDG